MRRWPRSIRCRAAATPPLQLVAPTDGRRVQRLAGRVERHQRDARSPRTAACCARGDVGVDGDHPGRPAGQDLLDPAPAGRRARPDLGEPHGELVLAGHLLDAAHDLDREVALERVERHLEDRRRADAVGPAVAVLAQQLLDPPAGLRGHPGASIEHLGDGRRGDPGQLGDRGHRQRAALGAAPLAVGRIQGHRCSVRASVAGDGR